MSDKHDVDVVMTHLDAGKRLDVEDVDEEVEGVAELHVPGLRVWKHPLESKRPFLPQNQT